MPKFEKPTPKPAPPPEEEIAPPEPAPPPEGPAAPKLPDCAGVSSELRAAVDTLYGRGVRILSVGAHSIIIHDGDPKRAGRRVPNPPAA